MMMLIDSDYDDDDDCCLYCTMSIGTYNCTKTSKQKLKYRRLSFQR